jgi:hypothetical protein
MYINLVSGQWKYFMSSLLIMLGFFKLKIKIPIIIKIILPLLTIICKDSFNGPEAFNISLFLCLWYVTVVPAIS